MVSGHSSVGTAPSSDGTAVASTPFSKTVNTGVSDAEQPHDTYSQSSSFAVPLSRAPPRTALEHQDSGGMCGGADRTHPVSQLREQFSQQTCSPPPHELMEELFESDNSDHVMDVGTKTDTSLSDDQFFKDFPHQGSYCTLNQMQCSMMSVVLSILKIVQCAEHSRGLLSNQCLH